MPESDNDYLRRARIMANRAAQFARTRRGKWIGIVLGALLFIYTVAGFLIVPHVLRSILTGQVGAALHRPVSVARVRFNPYTLRLKIDGFRAASRTSTQPFAGFTHLDVKVSWTSLFRIAPVVTEVMLVQPTFNLSRNADGTFNFDDLLAPSSSPSAPPPAAPANAPLKFSVSNIQIIDGVLVFDDQKIGVRHAINRFRLNIPFIANLPGKVDVVVQPLLQMVVDGQPVRIEGVSRPFAGTLDTALNLNFHRLDLPPYMGYLPPSIAIKLLSGALSMNVLVHFRQSDSGPSITLTGAVALDQFDLRDSSNAQVVAMDHGEIKMANVAPLDRVVYLREIALIGLKANVTRNHDGRLNLATLIGPSPPDEPAAAPAATPAATSAPQPVAPSPQEAPLDAGVESIKLIGGSVEVTDSSGGASANGALDAINAQVSNLRLNSQVPAEYKFAAKVRSGGNLSIKGTVDLAKSDLAAEVALDHLDLPALQPFAQQVLAANVASGELAAHGTLKTHFASDKFNLHAEPADAAIDRLTIQQTGVRDPPIAWTHFGVTVGNFDLASRQIDVKEIRGDAIKLSAKRSKGGDVSLAELIKHPAAAPKANPEPTRKRAPRRHEPEVHAMPAAAPEPPWNYQVESVALESLDARVEDRVPQRTVRAQFSPLNIHLKNVSSDLSKTMAIEIDGVRNQRGSFKVEGTAALAPLNAALHIESKDFDMAAVDDYVSTKLNAEITSAALTTKSDVELAQVQKDFHVKYRGNVGVGGFSAIDKITGDNFVNWRSLNVSGIDAVIGDGAPKVHVGAVALSNFNARLILNSTGKLNLNDIVASPNEAPKSLTRTEEEQPAAPAATPAPSAAAPEHPINADILVEKVSLDGGHVDYTDNFIQPHYSANLTDIKGSVGAFGTQTTQPAEVALQGEVNGSAPLNIDGSVNPLSPTAFVDLKATAEGIQLTGLSPYSTKYTGYPIVKGTLNVDVHYLMKEGELTANNHIFLDQLTFGDRVENSTAANLPVRFAVAVLKNSRGEIDLNIPVSGSLADPQFSIGSVIWGAFLNVITRAVTSPFSLLASAVGGIAGGGGNADLSYVAFDAGLATLTPDAKKSLTTLGNALQDHPDLKLTIRGRADPSLDVDGMREAWVAEQIRAQKIKDLGAADPESVEVTKEDYDKYLKRAYFKAKFSKPRYILGIAKTVPPDEMKKLMLENAPVSTDDLTKLADARANVVRRYLAATVSPGRLFVVAPQLDTEGVKEGPTTRVDLSLQ